MNGKFNLINLLRRPASASAFVRGGKEHPTLAGTVLFYKTELGTVVFAAVEGLPDNPTVCSPKFFGFHIHNGSKCSGTSEDEFADADGHLNPYMCLHPMHMGDMPPLIGAGGMAFSAFLTNSFTVEDVIGKTVIIHSGADDFRSQPGGDSGKMIACGEITATLR